MCLKRTMSGISGWVANSFHPSEQTRVAFQIKCTPAVSIYNLVFREWGHYTK